VEAPHNRNTAAGHEPLLYLEVRKRLEQGTLTPAPIQVWVKRAIRDHTCIVCQRMIRPGRVQNEFRADDGARASVHTLCLRAWVDVSRAPKAPER